MKTVRKTRSGGESCSCTTCVYKSESDHPSLRRFIALGSRIDRLYFGKYIPLRERKLLDRLVRTRAVYDDIRAQLLSDSTVNLSKKGDLKAKRKRSIRELDDTEKSSGAILQLVDMVDKGAMLGSKKLSDCCSCCSCSSKIQIHDHAFKRQRQKRGYAGAYEYQARERLGDAYNRKKGVRFKAKHIRSDPCACTFKFSGLIKKHSKALLKKVHPESPFPLLDLQPTTDEEINQKKGRVRDIARRSYENLKQSNLRVKEKLMDSITKIKQSQTRIQEKIEVQTRKSLEKIAQAKNKLKSKVRDSVQKIKTKKIKTPLICLCPEKEVSFQVKKDSISKFKEELRRKQILKDWECEPECVQDTCVPEECYVKLQQRKGKQQDVYDKGINYNLLTQERKSGESLSRSDYKIQVHKQAIVKKTETEKQKGISHPEPGKESKKPRVSFDRDNKRKKSQKPLLSNKKNKNCSCDTYKNKSEAPNKKNKNCSCDKFKDMNLKQEVHKPVKLKASPLKVKPEKKSSHKLEPVIAVPENRSVQKRPTSKTKPKREHIENKSLERSSSQRQAVRIGSSFSFNIEFYKNNPNSKIYSNRSRTVQDSMQRSGIDYSYKKPVKERKKIKKTHLRHHGSQVELQKSLKNTQTTALKRCFCTLKLKAKTTKSKLRRPKEKKLATTNKSASTVNSSIFPCTFDCTPEYYCEIEECRKALKLNNVQTNTDTKKKKTSRFTEKHKLKKLSKKSKLLPYECEPGVCTPGSCDPYECIKLINMRGNKKKRSESCVCAPNFSSSKKSKSTSSFTARSYKTSKTKQVQSMVSPLSDKHKYVAEKVHTRRRTISKPRRQAVRIGSTFSFNIEFYKGAPTYNNTVRPTNLKSFSIKPKQEVRHKAKLKNRGYQGSIRSIRRSITTQIYKKERNVLIGTKLKRCFCTLKFQKKNIKARSQKTTGTKTVDPVNILTEKVNKSTKTKAKYPKLLEPFECEPFTCIPGACDPYECLERINKRNRYMKEVGLTTYRPDTTSSSTYSGKTFKAVQVQYKPTHKERKTLVVTPKLNYTEKKSISGVSSSVKSRQAVKIGSTFSFDIEFYRNKPPANEFKYIYPEGKTMTTSTSKRQKDRGVKINKLNVAHIDTQVKGPKKRHKSSIVTPLLKRCFCTLNLQKKKKPKKDKLPVRKSLLYPANIYTVNRAFLEKTYANLDCNKNEVGDSYQNCPNFTLQKISTNNKYVSTGYDDNLLQINSVKLLRVSGVDQEILKTSEKYKEICKKPLKRDVKRLKNVVVGKGIGLKTSTSLSDMQYTQSTGLTKYFQQCFCTMNLKVENRGFTKRRTSKDDFKGRKRNQVTTHKLKSYECEPGVCVPGECNPYECKKMISKRYLKSFSKRSGTEYSSQSVSSSVNQRMPKSKTYKQQTMSPKGGRPKNYAAAMETNRDQCVRVGSSFSFDIQFSKNLSSPQRIIHPKYSSDTNLTKHRHKLTKVDGIPKKNRRDSTSQSTFKKKIPRGSLTVPVMKRCFCTLKLQKKGRLHKETNKPQLPSNEHIKVHTVNKGQNTKFKPLKTAHSLKPYECEPNICVPGQCNPYECLEKMKKRKYNKYITEFGTSTRPYDAKSTSTMTSDNQLKNKRKSRAINAKHEKVPNTSVKSKNDHESAYQNPLRNTVRVGSSFSFNVEFFKDQPSAYSYDILKKMKERNNFMSQEPKFEANTTSNYTLKKKSLRNKQSQIENTMQPASTLTNSFIKRCFCTANLHQSKKNKNLVKFEETKPVQEQSSPSFLKKCFCLLKNIKPRAKVGAKKINEFKTQEKKIITVKKVNKPKLDPYECPPGICTPDECNPYLCAKLLKKEKNKKKLKTSTTDAVATRSKSTNSQISHTKHVKTYVKSKNAKQSKDNKNVLSSSSMDRKVVRIGSKFSFDIEFSKGHSSTKENKIYQNIQLNKTKPSVANDVREKKTLAKNATDTTISHASQVKKNHVQDHATGINKLVKRCFCTLTLQNKKELKKKKKKKTDNLKTKSVMTSNRGNWQTHGLLPYECEPNICIPYQCDPFECEKKIKLRYKNKDFREFGMSTTLPKNTSVSSKTEAPRRLISKSQSVTNKNQQRVKRSPGKFSGGTELGQTKQAVRLSSTFSFNVEFFKDDNRDGYELENTRKKDHRKQHQNQKKIKHTATKNNNQTQSGNQIMKAQSTMTGFSPLKRCFCTLSLRKPANKLPLPKKPLKANVSTKTDVYKTQFPVVNLLPYECEPSFCVPGECDPITCFDRIKSRRQLYKDSGTLPGYKDKKKEATAMTKGKKAVNKKLQIRESKAYNKSFLNLKERRPRHRIVHEPLKNAVKIGSNFSFDIEFYKNKSSGAHGKLRRESIPIRYKASKKEVYTKKKQDVRRVKLKRTKSFNKHIHKKDIASQENKNNRTKIQDSTTQPFLKRCFCVFKLHKIGKKVKKAPSFKYKIARTQTMPRSDYKENKYKVKNLGPFECEPNICIPGECDPYQCEKRIRRRLQKAGSTETNKSMHISTFSSTNGPKRKPAKLQTVEIKPKKQRVNSRKMLPQKGNEDGKRQAVRIGSSFSFDVEFFKTNYPSSSSSYTTSDPEVKKTPLRAKKGLKIKSRAQQSTDVKKETTGSSVGPFLKKCFCTLKLHKVQDNKVPKTILAKQKQIREQKQHQVTTENKGVATKKIAVKNHELTSFECEPYFCVPGECDPYECEKRINMRRHMYKTKNTTTQMTKKYSPKSAGVKPENFKSQKNQTNVVNVTSNAHLDHPGIVEIPRFANIFNKQAVRIGSNFSFNIEFYKEILPPTAVGKPEFPHESKKKTKIEDNNLNVNVISSRNRGSQGYFGTKNKTVESANALKRCFCTLKLQNKTKNKIPPKEYNSKNDKYNKKNLTAKPRSKEKKTKIENRNVASANKTTPFPQAFEVRRVAVERKPKMLPKQTHIDVKSIGTKADKKLLKGGTDLNVTSCNLYLCQDGKTVPSKDMKTILPYMPTKFNKTLSKTVIASKNNKYLLESRDDNPRKTKITNRGKRLTRKKSKKHLHYVKAPIYQEETSTQSGFRGIKQFFTHCTQIFSQKVGHFIKNDNFDKNPKIECNRYDECNRHAKLPQRQKMQADRIKASKSERQERTKQLLLSSQPKKSKSLKLASKYDDKKCKEICPYYANNVNNMLNKSGDTKQERPVMSINIHKKQVGKNIPNEVVRSQKQRNKNKDILCPHCLMTYNQEQKNNIGKGKNLSAPLKVRFMETAESKSNLQRKKKTVKKVVKGTSNKHNTFNTKSDRVVQLCEYCYSCGDKINAIELQRAAGDQLINKKKAKKVKATADKNKKKKVDNVCSGEEARKPLFEMHLDSASYELLNKDEVVDRVTKLSAADKKKQRKNKIHKKSCRCCICLARQNKTGANITVQPKGSICEALGKIFGFSDTILSGKKEKPCVCGSTVCAKKAQKMAKTPDKLHQRYNWNRCVCGSPVCGKESAKMKVMSKNLRCICKEEMAKRRKKLLSEQLKKEKKERAIRLKKQKKEDKARKKKRKKEQKRMEKQINTKASDVVLLTESVVDIGKLGITACSDVLRTVARVAADPKHAYKTLQKIKNDPKLLGKHLRQAYAESGVAATTKRVRLRCLAMRGIKRVRGILESYAVTKYILYIASKDPKRRLVKAQRVRERFDFGCSLYMGSLRKRPFLSVYDRCPSFYPHCMSLLTVWKQFMDISLFLLAVVVWSPCILCMELCRAMMCCFFCTG